MNYRDITILNKTTQSYLMTQGLKQFIGKEITLAKFDNLEGEYNLLKYFIDYIIDERPVIKENETISYGLWLLKFVLDLNNYSIVELDENFQDWGKGASNAIYYYEMQRELCKNENATFDIPKFTQLIAISDGVLEGMPLQGIRYKEPDHMSGWYLTTSKYDGKISSMNVVPIQNIAIKRKDLLQFLALPPGYFFQTYDDYTCEIRYLSNLGMHVSGN